MALTGLIGKKNTQTQGFLQDGTRVPLTVVSAMGNVVTQLKTTDKDGYNSIKLGFEKKKTKKAGKETPRFFREIRIDDVQNVQLGSQVQPSDVFKPGDIVDVTGISKGKGFAGVVKRHHFKGGPRTHGQSDRERAPGSIGQTTTPGHVYRGKRMAGRMGQETATVKNLEIIDITNDGALLIKGLIPGGVNSIVLVRKVGESKKFVPLYKEISDKQETTSGEVQSPVEEIKAEEKNVQAAPEEVKPVEEPAREERTEDQPVLNSSTSGQPTVIFESKTQEEEPAASAKPDLASGEPKEEVRENAS